MTNLSHVRSGLVFNRVDPEYGPYRVTNMLLGGNLRVLHAWCVPVCLCVCVCVCVCARAPHTHTEQ